MYALLYYTHRNLFERVRAAAVHLMCVKVIAEKWETAGKPQPNVSVHNLFSLSINTFSATSQTAHLYLI